MAIHCLLDENMDVEVAEVLTLLGSPSRHVTEVCNRSATDQEVLDAAADFDVLITIDLFRQPDEWQAAKAAMLASVRIIRIRFGASQRDDALEQARALLWRWRDIESEMESRPEIRLTTLSGASYAVRFRTVDDVRTMQGPRQAP